MSTAESRHPSDIGPVVVMGVSGSGKSLIGEGVSERFGIPFIEGDKLHPQSNVDKMSEGTPLTDEDRWPWLDRVAAELKDSWQENGGAMAACSALKKAYRDRLRNEVGADLRFVFLEGSKELFNARMNERKHHFMPSSLLDSQFATLEEPSGEDDVITVNVDATPEEIIDAVAEKLKA